MEIAGNLFTHYNYTTTDISQKIKGDVKEITSIKSGLKIELNISEKDEVLLPDNSPFKNWKEARRFAGPLPFTFTYNDKTKEVLIIEGVRQNWKPKPIKINKLQINFLNTINLKNRVLANAFVIENIPYYWKKGRKELWK